MDPDPYAPPAAHSQTSTAAEGNLGFAAPAGLVAALVGALAWAMFVSATNIKIGFAAVGIGFLVGWSVRRVGHGYSPVYGYVAAVLSLLGCVAGDVLTDCVGVAQQGSRPTLDIISHLTPGIAWVLLQRGFQPLDVLFYFLAVSAGYRNAFSQS